MRPVVADAGYGQSAASRRALRERGLDHVVIVRSDKIARMGQRRCSSNPPMAAWNWIISAMRPSNWGTGPDFWAYLGRFGPLGHPS